MTPPIDDGDDLDAVVERALDRPETVTNAELERLLNAAGSAMDHDTVEGLSSIASHDPGTVDAMLETLRGQLVDGDRGERGDASMVLVRLAHSRPGRLPSVVPTLIDRLEDESVRVRNNAIQTLGYVAGEAPRTVAAAIPELRPWFDADLLPNRLYAVEIAYQVARESPDEVVPLLPELGALLVDRREAGAATPGTASREHRSQHRILQRAGEARGQRETIRSRAALALLEVAKARPGAVTDVVPRFVDVLENEDTLVIEEVLDALVLLAEDSPAELRDAVPALVGVLEGPADDDLKATALLALGFVADLDEAAVADAVEPALPAVRELLDADDPRTRGAAMDLLMYVAERYPDAIDARTLVDRLDDEHAVVRGSAARVLGIVGDDDARPHLEALTEESDDRSVRRAATRAIEAIEERSDGR